MTLKTLPMPIPVNYTLQPTNPRKGYKKLASKMSYTDGQAACKADNGWLAMPKSSEDVADINQICNITVVILKSKISHH